MRNTAKTRRTIAALLAAVALLSTLLAAPASASAPTSDSAGVGPWLDTTDRDAVESSYLDEFQQSLPDPQWTGDHATCDVGTISADYRAATFERINWFRSVAGVAPVSESLELSASAQEAVLTTAMSPSGGLTHTPPPTYACFTDAALQASVDSNLQKGRTGPGAVDRYMLDWGIGNEPVGHRNWLLSPTAQQFGSGDAVGGNGFASANVLYVNEGPAVVTSPSREIREPQGFVAWPARGYVPADVVFPRWSFSLRGADFSSASVVTERVEASGSTAIASPVVFDSQNGSTPFDILVWEPALGFDADGMSPLDRPGFDEVYRVTIADVVIDGTSRSFSYEVIVIGDEVGPTPPSRGDLASGSQPNPDDTHRSVGSINGAPDVEPAVVPASIGPERLLARASALGADVSRASLLSS